MRVIVTVSGGKSSAWCVDWALKNYSKENVILYFNDTKWEHPDTYRFLLDLSNFFNHEITYDNDGRTPEQIFYDKKVLGNNWIPVCSKILKCKRLEKYIVNGDIVIFGINPGENHRAIRIKKRLEKLKRCKSYIPID